MKPLIISVFLIACSQYGRGESGKIGQDADTDTDNLNHPDSGMEVLPDATSDQSFSFPDVFEVANDTEKLSDSGYPACPCTGSDVCCIARDHQDLGERCYPDATSCYCTSTSKLVCINAGMQCCVDRCGVICP